MDVSVKNRLKFYLGPFWVQPSKDQELIKEAENSYKSEQAVQAYLITDKKKLYQFVQAVILTPRRQVEWAHVDSYGLIESYIAGESVSDKYFSSEILFILHGFSTMPNKQLHNMTNQVISTRECAHKKTYLLSLKNDAEFNRQFKTIRTNRSEVI